MRKRLRFVTLFLGMSAVALTVSVLLTFPTYAAETSKNTGATSSVEQGENKENFVDEVSSYSNILALLGVALTLFTFFHKDHKTIKFRVDASKNGKTSLFSFWNSSNQTIYWDDIYEGHLELKTSVPVILRRIYMNDVTNIQTNNDGSCKSFNITFDMLLPKKGALFVIEDRKANKDHSFSFIGRIKGEKQYSVSYYSSLEYFNALIPIDKIMTILWVIVSLVFILIGAYTSYLVIRGWNQIHYPALLLLIIIGLGAFGIWSLLLSLGGNGRTPQDIRKRIHIFKSKQKLSAQKDGNKIKYYADEYFDELKKRDYCDYLRKKS